jgi:phosphate-selective porin OprO and OprP
MKAMMKKLILSTTALAVLAAAPAFAASDADVVAMSERIKMLESQLLSMKKEQDTIVKRQLAQDVRAAKVAAMVEPAGGGGEGKVRGATSDVTVNVGPKGIELKKGNSSVRIGGLLQTDARYFLGDATPENADDTFDIRRARLHLDGDIGDFYYRVYNDFGGTGSTLNDAYLGYTFDDALDLRVGKFKPGIGLERMKSPFDTTFLEPGISTQLTPTYDIGVQLSGAVLGKKLTYQLAVINGAVDDANAQADIDDNKEFTARLMAEPVKGFAFGLGGSTGQKAGETGGTLMSSGYRTTARTTFFTYSSTTLADGKAWRVAPQAYVYQGPFSLLGEYEFSHQDVRVGTTRKGLTNTGWNTQVGWVLTGEDASFKSVSPANAFDPAADSWGAWEIAARVGQLDIDDDAFGTFATASTSASKATNYGFVLNGYLNDQVRVSLDYEHTTFDGGKTGGADRDSEKALLSRVGLKF